MSVKPKLVIFDVDGTISDSMAVIVDSWMKAARAANLSPPSRAAVRDQIGKSVQEGFEALFPDAEEGALQKFFPFYRDIYRGAVVGNEPPLYDGTREVLEQLEDARILMAVATGKSRVGLDRMLKDHDLARFFAHTVTADNARSKPHPDMIQQILKQLGLTPPEALMVGDTSFDLDMARNAGVPSIGVTHGGHDPDTLRACQPIALIDHLTELLPYALPHPESS